MSFLIILYILTGLLKILGIYKLVYFDIM